MDPALESQITHIVSADPLVDLCNLSSSGEFISVTVKLSDSVNVSSRSTVLLDLEDKLIKLDPSIRVWHASIGDKNSLRNLRGITLGSLQQ